MVSSPGNTPPRRPFEIIIDTLTSRQRDVQALNTSVNALQGNKGSHQAPRSLVVAVGGLAAGLVLSTAVLMWWTRPPATPNYTPAFFAIDTVLVESWKSLSKELQGKLELAYRAGQVRSPTDRK